jgi:hypothetical protein
MDRVERLARAVAEAVEAILPKGTERGILGIMVRSGLAVLDILFNVVGTGPSLGFRWYRSCDDCVQRLRSRKVCGNAVTSRRKAYCLTVYRTKGSIENKKNTRKRWRTSTFQMCFWCRV